MGAEEILRGIVNRIFREHGVPVLTLMALAIIAVFVAAAGCTNSPGNSESAGVSGPAPVAGTGSGGGLAVVTSFRPLTLLIAPVGGNHTAITQILPPGADPHDYEPTPADAVALKNGKIFFYDGPFLEPWAADLATSSNPDIQRVTFSDAIPDTVYQQMKNRYADFPDPAEDPHFWLSPQLAEYYVPYAARRLSEADPGNATDYGDNAAVFEKRLQQLDADYEAGFSNCTTRTFLSSHAFLDYTAAAYNLTPISISGMSPDAEPSLQQMAAIVGEAKARNVRGVLAEPDEAEDLSKSLSAELGLPVYPFTTMEVLPKGPLAPADTDYVAIMETNLQEMKKAMVCQ
ncbi:MAG TPA: metal ABC transporter substrate-binding protein [Methanoregula sp.]|nr:metal ABC transporter substrate-binding protein [Methanoregula sp.]